jgi:hypothetical protein
VLGVAAAAVLLACTTPAKYFVAPGQEGAPGLHRVLLSPMNLVRALPAEISDGAQPVEKALLDHLKGRGLEVSHLDLLEGRKLWGQAVLEAQQQGSKDAAPLFVQHLAARGDFEVVMLPSFITRTVYVNDNIGTWDGVRRRMNVVNAPSRGIGGSTDTFTKGVFAGGVSGSMLATSLHLIIFSRQGERVFEGIGGFDFVHEVDLSAAYQYKVNFRRRARLPGSPEVVREGVAIALGSYLPSDPDR